MENNFVGILTTIFKKKLIEKYNIKFNNCYNIIGDFDYFVNLSKKVKFHYIHKPLAIYRMHKKNYSLLNSKLYLKEINFWDKNNKNNFKKYNFQNFINKKNYFTIKINIINREYKKAIVNLINFPFSLQKLKLFIMFFLSKKNLYL